MTLTLEFPALDVPAEVPVLQVRPPEWTLDTATELAKGMDIAASAADACLCMLARDDRAALEVYRASSSFRYSRLDLDGEGRDGMAGVPDRGRHCMSGRNGFRNTNLKVCARNCTL